MESLYCNMTTREVTPLCYGDVTEDCFDLDVAEKQLTGQVGRSLTTSTTKKFSRVVEWAPQ